MTVQVAFAGAVQIDVLGWIAGTDMPAAPSSVKFGLLTAIPTHDGVTLHELSGNGYARQTVTFGSVSTDNTNRISSMSNTNAIIFGPSTADWAAVTYGAYFDGTTGDMLAYGALATPRTAPNGDTISFGAGALQLRLQ